MLDVAMEAVSMGSMALLIGFCLHYLLYKRDMAYDIEEYKAGNHHDDDFEDSENGERTPGDSVLKKWMDFGGGYYGTIALIELIFIELEQISDFAADWPGLGQFISELSVPVLVSFFVEQFTNFAAAISWPGKYFSGQSFQEIAMFVAITWAFYAISKLLARKFWHRNNPHFT